jgi:DNA-binding LacI/PurR family transcriptional regulator
MARVTIDEVAARAGVTKSTVSHALSGKRPVAPETRQRIEAAIADLGYRPSALARGLAAGRTGVIGLAYEPAMGLSATEVVEQIKAANDAVAAAGFAMALISGVEGRTAQLERYIEVGLLDGIMVGQVRAEDGRVGVLRAAGVPFALLGRTADNGGIAFVDTDSETAIEMCVEHLHALGHERIAYLGKQGAGEPDLRQAPRAFERACLRRRMRFFAPHPHPTSCVNADAARRLLLEEGVTGLIAAGATMAARVWLIAADCGKRVPDDVSLLCLGLEPESAAHLIPGMSGVNLRYAEQARLAAELVINELDGGSPRERQILLEPEWVDGETSGPPNH